MEPDYMRFIVRGYRAGKLVAEHEHRSDQMAPETVIEELIAILGEDDSPHMIELEFLDEPNPNERFFRFGSDPTLMVRPLEIDLNSLRSRGEDEP